MQQNHHGMQHNDVLNGVLVLLRRSLLQYAAEASPWMGTGASEVHLQVDRLIAAQSERVRKLVDLLDERRWTTDFGAFRDFTDLHYLSLAFLLPHLVENQTTIVREIERALPQCAGDSAAIALVAETLVGESQALSELQQLVAKRAKPAVQTVA
jgi:hypothetical protein